MSEKNKKENAVLSEKPMLTADQQEIVDGMIVYTMDYEFSSYKGEREKVEYIANRIFHVNNKDRVFRYRCAKGCEHMVSMRDGCNVIKVYGTKKGILDDLALKIDKKLVDILNYRDTVLAGKIKRNKEAYKKISSFKKSLKAFSPKMPK